MFMAALASPITVLDVTLTTLATLNLPDAAYLLHAQATVENNDGQHDAPILCYLTGNAFPDAQPHVYGLMPFVSGELVGSSLSVRTLSFFDISLSGGTIKFECMDNSGWPSMGATFHDVRFIAVRADTVGLQ
jgi:hypothetical protein